MSAVVLVCGQALSDGESSAIAERDDLAVTTVSERPGKDELRPVLSELTGRLVVVGSDADLAAVALRLLRTERLANVQVGFVPRAAGSAVAGLWGLPEHPRHAFALALDGEIDPVPLVRDDSGGVLVGRGELRRVRGVAYCDDQRVLRGKASKIVVHPDPEGGLAVRITGGLLRGERRAHGRAFQLGCLPTVPEFDGVRHPRSTDRWTWYRHTEDLRLARGLV